jgi:hypothetical protein
MTRTSFLEQLDAEISFYFGKVPLDPRAVELVNKTNQFNLNGKRYTEASWGKYLLDSSSFPNAGVLQGQVRSVGENCGAGGSSKW